MKTKDYFKKAFLSPQSILASFILIIALRKWQVIFMLIFGWLITYVRVRMYQNVYEFDNDGFKIVYPRKIWGVKVFRYEYEQISSIILKRLRRFDKGREIEIQFSPKRKETIYYSNLMSNKEEEEFIQEFKNRLGDNRVKDDRYGNVIKVPK